VPAYPPDDHRASAEYLRTVRADLARRTDQELIEKYDTYLAGCVLKDGKPPEAWWPQFLVQAWKELRRRVKA
jgi:hypothetical protein